MVNSKKKSPRMYTKKWLLLVAVLTFAVLGYVAFWYNNNTAPSTSTGSQKDNINYGPPTKGEQAAGDDQKQQNIDHDANLKPPETANVVISNASQSGSVVRVRAFISNAVESGGVCTTRLVKDGSTVAKQTAAFADATSTQCGAVDFDRSQFSTNGTWTVTVDYKSNNLAGSANGSLEIQ